MDSVDSRGADQQLRRKPRQDAARNRDALVAAARQEFEENGTECSLKAVARRAGVGVATLYRNFPTRDSLVEAVYADETAMAVEHLRRAQRQGADPRVALVDWLDLFSCVLVQENGLRQALKPGGTGRVPARQILGEVLGGLLEKAAAADHVVPEIDPQDLLCAAASLAVSPFLTDTQRSRVVAAFMVRAEQPPACVPTLCGSERYDCP